MVKSLLLREWFVENMMPIDIIIAVIRSREHLLSSLAHSDLKSVYSNCTENAWPAQDNSSVLSQINNQEFVIEEEARNEGTGGDSTKWPIYHPFFISFFISLILLTLVLVLIRIRPNLRKKTCSYINETHFPLIGQDSRVDNDADRHIERRGEHLAPPLDRSKPVIKKSG